MVMGFNPSAATIEDPRAVKPGQDREWAAITHAQRVALIKEHAADGEGFTIVAQRIAGVTGSRVGKNQVLGVLFRERKATGVDPLGGKTRPGHLKIAHLRESKRLAVLDQKQRDEVAAARSARAPLPTGASVAEALSRDWMAGPIPNAGRIPAAAAQPAIPVLLPPEHEGRRPQVARHTAPPRGYCQFPRGVRPLYDFCGAPTARGESWCDACRARVWVNPPPFRPESTAAAPNF
jgi:hypothetical protein